MKEIEHLLAEEAVLVLVLFSFMCFVGLLFWNAVAFFHEQPMPYAWWQMGSCLGLMLAVKAVGVWYARAS